MFYQFYNQYKQGKLLHRSVSQNIRRHYKEITAGLPGPEYSDKKWSSLGEYETYIEEELAKPTVQPTRFGGPYPAGPVLRQESNAVLMGNKFAERISANQRVTDDDKKILESGSWENFIDYYFYNVLDNFSKDYYRYSYSFSGWKSTYRGHSIPDRELFLLGECNAILQTLSSPVFLANFDPSKKNELLNEVKNIGRLCYYLPQTPKSELNKIIMGDENGIREIKEQFRQITHSDSGSSYPPHFDNFTSFRSINNLEIRQAFLEGQREEELNYKGACVDLALNIFVIGAGVGLYLGGVLAAAVVIPAIIVAMLLIEKTNVGPTIWCKLFSGKQRLEMQQGPQPDPRYLPTSA